VNERPGCTVRRSNEEDQLSRVIAVVPTFNPDEGLLDRLGRIASQVERVVVADDGSDSRAEPVLAAVANSGYQLIRSAANSGIASALNIGVRRALGDGADYVLTVDQDSELQAGYVNACLGVFADAIVTRIGAVCVDRINGAPALPRWHSPEGFGIVPDAIQSGMFISSESLEKCGLFDERLFIDGVDTEYCLRLARGGYFVAVASGTALKHELGERRPLRPLGLSLSVRGEAETYEYHAPTRRYFITRNTLDLFFRYARYEPRWALSAARRELMPAVNAVLSGPYRGRQLIATLAGAFDGLRRARGRMSPLLRRVLTPRA
jgi:rhamnosyltransferase